MKQKGWIGFDLDGTLAKYDKWLAITHIGEPIEPMVKKVRELIGEGWEIRIFTARVSNISENEKIAFQSALDKWTAKHIGKVLKATNIKDHEMAELWDDRAISVDKNTGKAVRFEHGKITSVVTL